MRCGPTTSGAWSGNTVLSIIRPIMTNEGFQVDQCWLADINLTNRRIEKGGVGGVGGVGRGEEEEVICKTVNKRHVTVESKLIDQLHPVTSTMSMTSFYWNDAVGSVRCTCNEIINYSSFLSRLLLFLLLISSLPIQLPPLLSLPPSPGHSHLDLCGSISARKDCEDRTNLETVLEQCWNNSGHQSIVSIFFS